jgi:hypothetical protein
MYLDRRCEDRTSRVIERRLYQHEAMTVQRKRPADPRGNGPGDLDIRQFRHGEKRDQYACTATRELTEGGGGIGSTRGNGATEEQAPMPVTRSARRG